MIHSNTDGCASCKECGYCKKAQGGIYLREDGSRERCKAHVRRENVRARTDAMRGLGLVRVRGAQGGIYWE